VAVLAFPRPLVDRQRARLAVRERQLVVLQQRQAAELKVALERVETERKALALLENSPRPELRANEAPGSSNAV
jgi:hypothetical protein